MSKATEFFPEGYTFLHPEVKDSGLSPWEHYCQVGRAKGYSKGQPLPDQFNAERYLAMYPSVAEAKIDPWRHYVRYGHKEGRSNGITQGRDFFADGYAFLHPEVALSGLSPWEHYCQVGLAKGYTRGTPTQEQFDGKRYLKMYPGVAAAKIHPWRHYVRYGHKEGRSNGITQGRDFFAEGYTFLHPEVALSGLSPWEHYCQVGLEKGYTRGTPSADQFDGKKYLAMYHDVAKAKMNPWQHYVLYGVKSGRTSGMKKALTPSIPHVSEVVYSPNTIDTLKKYFDTEYYLSQLDENDAKKINDPIQHYLNEGYKQGLSPNIYFDPEYYIEKNKDVQESGIVPFVHFIFIGKDDISRLFHPLIDNKYIMSYCKNNKIKIKKTILDHLMFSHLYVRPHILFDENYYIKKIETRCSKNNIFKYFLQNNKSEKFSCIASFDNDYYINHNNFKNDNIGIPLIHYIKRGYRESYSFNPVFDAMWYIDQSGIEIENNDIPLSHLYSTNFKYSYCKFFDVEHYKEFSFDLIDINLSSEGINRHFIEYGYKEKSRKVNKLFSVRYIYNKHQNCQFLKYNHYQKYFSEDYHKRKILYIGHEGSLTGAPLILLNIMRYIHKIPSLDYDQFCILGRKGVLSEEFAVYSHVLHADDFQSSEECIDYFDRYVGFDKVDYIIFNSFESRKFYKIFQKYTIKNVLLCHELMDNYYGSPLEYIKNEIQYFYHIIFPANCVKQNFLEYFAYPEEQTSICHQAMNTWHFGKFIKKDKYRKNVLEELQLPENAKIVLGCGTIDYRKGADLFVSAAITYLKSYPENSRTTFFLWIGSKTNNALHLRHWAFYDITRFHYEKNILFLDETKDVEKYFAAADVFLLTSRSDPFPCVAQEAMAMRVPVVCFQTTGGIAELLENKQLGYCVPYQDTTAMAKAVAKILSGASEKKIVQMVADAHNFTSEHFTIQKYVWSILKTLDVELPSKFDNIENDLIRVYFTSPDFSISGVNTFIVELIRHMDKKRFHPVLVLTLGKNYNFDESEMPKDIECIFLQPDDAHPVPMLVQDFLQKNAPCIFVPGFDYVASSCSASLGSKVGIVGVLQANDKEHYDHLLKEGKYWDKIVCVEQDIYEHVLSINPLYKTRTCVINNAISCHDALPQTDRMFDFSNDNTIPSFLYVGRIEQFQKRIHDIGDVIDKFEERHFSYTFTFIGDGTERNALERRLRVPMRNGRVLFTGRLEAEAIYEWYTRSHFFVQLSDFEGQSLSLMEAMDAGCIPICYPYSKYLSDMVIPGKTGFITKEKTPKSFLATLDDILYMKNLSSISRNAHDYIISSTHNAKQMAKTYGNIFENIIVNLSKK